MSTDTRRVRPSAAMIVAVAALVAALAGTAVAADQGATTSALNKKKVKKIATKQVNKLAPGLSVASAGFAENVLAATVPVGNSCDVTSQTGGISATIAGNPANTKCDVTFPRSVEDCAVGANPLHPSADVGGEATIRMLGGADVKVGRYDSVGGTPTAGLFSIYAICPGPDGL